jgi:hypothetical protein
MVPQLAPKAYAESVTSERVSGGVLNVSIPRPNPCTGHGVAELWDAIEPETVNV